MSIKEKLEKEEGTVEKDIDEANETKKEFEIKLVKVGKLKENTSGFNGSPPICL